MLIEGEDESRAMLQFKTEGINNFTKAKLYDNLSKDLHNKPNKLNHTGHEHTIKLPAGAGCGGWWSTSCFFCAVSMKVALSEPLSFRVKSGMFGTACTLSWAEFRFTTGKLPCDGCLIIMFSAEGITLRFLGLAPHRVAEPAAAGQKWFIFVNCCCKRMLQAI